MSGEAAYWDRLGADWVGTARQAVWREHNDRVVARWLAERWPREARGRLLKTDAFEEAVGDGLAGQLDRGGPAVLIDLALPVVTAARRRHPGLSGVRADVRRLPFADATFALVVSTSTLDHFSSLAQLETALGELRRVLAPGGDLLLTLDNRSNPVVALRNALGPAWRARLRLTPYAVGATCGPRALVRRVRGAGLDPLDVRTLLHCPRAPAVWLAALVQRRCPARAPALGRFLTGWEALGRLPTHPLTGYFTALHARRPG